MKYVISLIAIIITFVGYIPYLRDTIKHKTKPHIFTWLIWSVVGIIAFGLQIQSKAGIGSLVTLASAIICFTVFVFGFFQPDFSINIKKIDVVFLVSSFGALIIWLVAKQPVVSVIMLCVVDMLGFLPTIRKSWSKPFEETLFSYVMNAIRFSLALVALENYNFVAMFYPLYWALAEGIFAIFLLIRRKQIKNYNQ